MAGGCACVKERAAPLASLLFVRMRADAALQVLINLDRVARRHRRLATQTTPHAAFAASPFQASCRIAVIPIALFLRLASVPSYEAKQLLRQTILFATASHDKDQGSTLPPGITKCFASDPEAKNRQSSSSGLPSVVIEIRTSSDKPIRTVPLSPTSIV